MSLVNESVADEATLESLSNLGCTVMHGPDLGQATWRTMASFSSEPLTYSPFSLRFK